MNTNTNVTNVTNTNATIIKTVELTLWFEGREKDGYVPFDPESTDDNVKIQKALIKPLMYFGSVLASDFGTLAMPKGIEIVDGTESVYDSDLNVMTSLIRLNFTDVKKEITSDSLIQAFKTWETGAPYYLIGVSCKNDVFPCPEACKQAMTFEGIETEDWFLYVRDEEPRPQFPKSAWKMLKKPIMVSETGISWSKKYDQVTGGFKAFAARKKAADSNAPSDSRETEKSDKKDSKETLRKIALNRLQKNDGYPIMTNLPKGNITEEEHMTVYSFGTPVNRGHQSDDNK